MSKCIVDHLQPYIKMSFGIENLTNYILNSCLYLDFSIDSVTVKKFERKK